MSKIFIQIVSSCCCFLYNLKYFRGCVVVSCITCVSPRYFVEMSHKLPMKCEYECLLVFLSRFFLRWNVNLSFIIMSLQIKTSLFSLIHTRIRQDKKKALQKYLFYLYIIVSRWHKNILTSIQKILRNISKFSCLKK